MKLTDIELLEWKDAPLDLESYRDKKRELQKIQMSADTSKSPALKRELARRFAELRQEAIDAGLISAKDFYEDADQVPEIGNVIRTKKSDIEGKVERLGNNEVFFRLADGRLMKTPLDNVIVIEKLADEDDEILEATGLSNDLLARYKTAAGKDASNADKKGDFKKGDKRFSGIVKATNKQFDNDAKKEKVNELSPGVYKKYIPAANASRTKATVDQNNKGGYDPKVVDKMERRAGHTITAINKSNNVREAGQGGINRCAPANDVSYQDILNDVKDKWHNDSVIVNELSNDKLQDYKYSASSPENFKKRPLRKLVKTVRGVEQANNKIDKHVSDQSKNNWKY